MTTPFVSFAVVDSSGDYCYYYSIRRPHAMVTMNIPLVMVVVEYNNVPAVVVAVAPVLAAVAADMSPWSDVAVVVVAVVDTWMVADVPWMTAANLLVTVVVVVVVAVVAVGWWSWYYYDSLY